MPEPLLLFVLDLTGTFTFALNGALTAVRAVRVDIVGVLTLGMVTALGGGITRDILLDDVPPATFVDWRYLAVAAGGSLIAFVLSRHLDRLTPLITIFDAMGLSVFAVMGAGKALNFGLGIPQAIILGTITAVGGGTLRDVLIGRVPTVLRSELYAVPALLAASITTLATVTHTYGIVAVTVAAVACFTLRMAGVHFHWHAPYPFGRRGAQEADVTADAG